MTAPTQSGLPTEAPTDPLAPQASSSAVGSRDTTAFDVFKGLAILEVVIHHSSGMSLRFLQADSLLYALLAGVNRTLHFAVPAFLFMSALLLARSALNKPFQLGHYLNRRLLRSGLPYVLWTVLYTIFKVLTTSLTLPELFDLERWVFWLRYGKGYYHLYFLIVALQFYLLFPLLLSIFRRRQTFLVVLGVAVALQIGIYFLNREVFRFQFPATVVWWYLLPIVLGMYFGAKYSRFYEVWRRFYSVVLVVAGLAAVWYVSQAYGLLRGDRVDNFHYALSSWLYTSAMALTVLGAAHSLTQGRLSQHRLVVGVRDFLAQAGQNSLQIYLIHPALLFFFAQWGFPGSSVGFVLILFSYITVAVLLPLGLGRVLSGTWLSRVLFGGR